MKKLLLTIPLLSLSFLSAMNGEKPEYIPMTTLNEKSKSSRDFPAAATYYVQMRRPESRQMSRTCSVPCEADCVIPVGMVCTCITAAACCPTQCCGAWPAFMALFS